MPIQGGDFNYNKKEEKKDKDQPKEEKKSMEASGPDNKAHLPPKAEKAKAEDPVPSSKISSGIGGGDAQKTMAKPSETASTNKSKDTPAASKPANPAGPGALAATNAVGSASNPSAQPKPIGPAAGATSGGAGIGAKPAAAANPPASSVAGAAPKPSTVTQNSVPGGSNSAGTRPPGTTLPPASSSAQPRPQSAIARFFAKIKNAIARFCCQTQDSIRHIA